MPRIFGSIWPLASVFLLFLMAGAAAAQHSHQEPPPVPLDGFQADREYVKILGQPVLFEPEDGRIEVLSYFWYNCNSCYTIDEDMSRWAAKLPADVRLVRLPAVFNPAVAFHARIFLTLQALDLGEEANRAVFRLFREERKPVNQPEQLPDLARMLKVDPDKFVKTFNSPQVGALLDRVEKSMNDYLLPGVPAMVIDGRYRFDIGTAHGPEGYKKLAEFLIEKRRQDRKSGPGDKK